MASGPHWRAHGGIPSCILRPCGLTEQRLPSCQTLRAPDLAARIVLSERARPGRQHDPRLLRLGVDVHVGREAVRLIERADAHEAHEIPEAAIIMTPHGHATGAAARDPLALTAVARCGHELRAPGCELQARRLDERVEHKRTPRLPLTPAAMTTMHDEWAIAQAVAHGPAGTAAVSGKLRGCSHVRMASGA